MGHRSPHELLPELGLQKHVMSGVQFTLSTNAGVVFGLPMPRWTVAVATVLTILLVCFFFATSERSGWIAHVALAFILSGALGNLYDRLFSEVVIAPGVPPIVHEVRDFVDCSQIHCFGLNWPWVFNVADMLLVVGVVGLLLQWAVTRKKPAAAAAARA
jgi:signal peptidase II